MRAIRPRTRRGGRRGHLRCGGRWCNSRRSWRERLRDRADFRRWPMSRQERRHDLFLNGDELAHRVLIGHHHIERGAVPRRSGRADGGRMNWRRGGRRPALGPGRADRGLRQAVRSGIPRRLRIRRLSLRRQRRAIFESQHRRAAGLAHGLLLRADAAAAKKPGRRRQRLVETQRVEARKIEFVDDTSGEEIDELQRSRSLCRQRPDRAQNAAQSPAVE